MGREDRSATERAEGPSAGWFRIGVVLLVLGFLAGAVSKIGYLPWSWWESVSWWKLLALEAEQYASPMLVSVGLLVLAGPVHRMAEVWKSRALRAGAWLGLGVALALLAELCVSLRWACGVLVPAFTRPLWLVLTVGNCAALALLCALGCLGAVRVSRWSREMRWARWVAWVLALLALRLVMVAAQYVLSGANVAFGWRLADDLDGAAAWALMVLAVAGPVVGVVVVRRSERLFERPERGDVCRGCGYDLRGFEGAVCPECGVGREARRHEGTEARRERERRGAGADDPDRLGVPARRMRRCAKLVSWGCGLLVPGGVFLTIWFALSLSGLADLFSGPEMNSPAWEAWIALSVFLMMSAAIGALLLVAVAAMASWPLRWYGRTRANMWLEPAARFFVGVPILIATWCVLASIREGPDLSSVVGLLLAAGFWCLARGVALEIERGDRSRRARRARVWLRITALVVALDAISVLVAAVVSYVEMSIGMALEEWANALPAAMLLPTLVIVMVGLVGARGLGEWMVGEGAAGAGDAPSAGRGN